MSQVILDKIKPGYKVLFVKNVENGFQNIEEMAITI